MTMTHLGPLAKNSLPANKLSDAQLTFFQSYYSRMIDRHKLKAPSIVEYLYPKLKDIEHEISYRSSEYLGPNVVRFRPKK